MKSCMFVKKTNPSLKHFHFKLTKIWVHNNGSSSEKVHPLLSSHIKIHPHICLELFWTVFTCMFDLCIFLSWFRWDNFIQEKAILWTEDLSLKFTTSWWVCFLQTRSFSLQNTLIDGLESCGLLWCFYQLFGLSFWRHPFTAKHLSEISSNLFRLN